jgi:hypothetical protein
MMAQVKPPRPVFVNFPLGHPCGKPHRIELQRSILTDALQYFINASEPGKVLDLPYEWGKQFTFDDMSQSIEDMIEKEGWPRQEWVPTKSD